jgi:HJR/Mrr/RecB family endonuclease
MPPLTTLVEEVQSSQDKLYSLSPRNFELFVGTVLKNVMNCDVEHVGGTGDGGFDLVVVDADPPLLVQVKRRGRPGSREGIEVVKHMFASLYAAGHKRGMIVTSANQFTRGAQTWAVIPRSSEDSSLSTLSI